MPIRKGAEPHYGCFTVYIQNYRSASKFYFERYHSYCEEVCWLQNSAAKNYVCQTLGVGTTVYKRPKVGVNMKDIILSGVLNRVESS